MARAPRAKVSKTSGAGVSRLSYQQGYAKGNKGSAMPGGSPGVPKASITDESLKGGGRGGTKQTGAEAGGMNVSYGDTLPIGDLKDIESFSKGKPSSPNFLKPGKDVKFGGGKGRSGYAKK